ncbi:MAG: lipoprotein insertase outer membrane protein LolB [Gammaproteobacteria bacterium]|nr:lipoprotein insertase outer membrane protein LolB [Gammaproteobacteria bacterium]
MLSLSFLAACQSSPKKPVNRDLTETVWSTDKSVFADKVKMVSDVSTWNLQSKVAVSGGSLRESANLVWRAGPEGGSLRFFGPLGAGALLINYDSSGASLVDGNKQKIEGHSVEAVLQQAVGWYLPLDALIYWVHGIPNPKYAYRYSLGVKQELSALEQLGWELSFSKYAENKDNGFLPRSITGRRLMLINGLEEQMTIKILVKSFNFDGYRR